MSTTTTKRFGAQVTDIEYRERSAVRLILENNAGLFALLHIQNGQYHKLPGGGIDPGEEHEQAIAREAMEETGCVITDPGKCIAVTEEWRDGLHQFSYLYAAKVVKDTKELHLTEAEITDGLTVEWIPLQVMLDKLASASPTTQTGCNIKERDLYLATTFAAARASG